MTSDTASILVVDNHDSFVHTLVGYLHELGADTDLVEADAIETVPTPSPDAAGASPGASGRVGPTAASVIAPYRGVLVSPGPGTPARAGASIAVVREAAAAGIPLLGVCLGHQAIAEAYGATVAHAPELMHGMTSLVEHDDSVLYEGLPSPFTATRYHSLAISPETMPADLVVTSRTRSGVIMGIAHRTAPILGVQFHPEAVLTEGGHRLLGNWLGTIGFADAASRGAALHPRR